MASARGLGAGRGGAFLRVALGLARWAALPGSPPVRLRPPVTSRVAQWQGEGRPTCLVARAMAQDRAATRLSVVLGHVRRPFSGAVVSFGLRGLGRGGGGPSEEPSRRAGPSSSPRPGSAMRAGGQRRRGTPRRGGLSVTALTSAADVPLLQRPRLSWGLCFPA